MTTSSTSDFNYRDIQGWFDFENIYKRAIERATDGALFVEVGAWRGSSTGFMANAIKRSGKEIGFHAVDTWRGSNEEYHRHAVAQAGGDLFPEFWENMQRLEVQELVRPMQMHSVDAARHFERESIDFCYIDASHDYQSVRNDIRAWLPKIKRKGVIAGHDIDRVSVKAAIQDAIPWSQVEEIGSSWWWEKEGTTAGTWKRREEMRFQHPSHLVCIPCVTNEDLLDRTVRSVLIGGANVAVFDTSEHGLNLGAFDWTDKVSIFKTRFQPTFTQAMNLIQAECRSFGIRWLIFMHSDARCLDDRVLSDLLSLAEHRNATERLGVLFTNYDSFCAFNMDAIADVGPWDETFEWYCADNDYYHRFRLRGWVVDRSADLEARVEHDVSASLRSDGKLANRVSELLGHRHAHLDHKWQGAKRVPYQP